jgi:tetratricopeptide (TPR) repeat protein
MKGMDRSKQASFWFRLALPLLFLLLFGLSPRPQRLELTFQQVQQARRVGDLTAEAGALATLAHDLPWQAELWEQAGRAALNAGLVDEATAYLEQALSAGRFRLKDKSFWGMPTCLWARQTRLFPPGRH